MTTILPFLGLYGFVIALLVGAASARTGGTWIYPLDDAYIHMALARNMAEYGTWGISPKAYAPVSSSPLYTLLLTLLWKIHPWALWPLIVNFLMGSLFLIYLDRALPIHGWRRVWFISSVLFGVPLPLVVVLGMEHTLHITVMVWILLVLRRWLQTRSKRDFRLLIVLGVIAGGLRYESLFLGAAIGLILVRTRRFREAVGIAAAFALVPLLYGGFNLAHGWPFLPSTLLMKAPPFQFHRFWEWLLVPEVNIYANALGAPEVMVVAAGLLYLTARLRHIPSRRIGTVVLIQILLHYALARVGWFVRYEAYLAAMSLVTIGLFVVERQRLESYQNVPVFMVFVGMGLIASARSLYLFLVPGVSWNIYALPYQSARIARSFPPNVSLALWDIGLPGFKTDRPIVDLAGLASLGVTRLRFQGKEEEIARRLVKMDRPDRPIVGLVYDRRFPYARKNWILVGFWEIPPSLWVITAGYRMSVYAMTPENASRVREWFAGFVQKKGFPEGIRWHINPP